MYTARPIEFDSRDYKESLTLRNQVLRIPLGLDLLAENLSDERSQLHYGLFDDAELVGCVVAAPRDVQSVKLRQMAVRADRHRQGLGQRLLEWVEADLKQRGFAVIVLHARIVAVRFYERLGYTEIGEPFIEVGIPHVAMQKTL